MSSIQRFVIGLDKGAKGGTYLVCGNAKRKVGDCKRYGWRYPETQAHIVFNLIDELDFTEVLPELFTKAESRADRINDSLITKEGELEAVNKKIDNGTEALLEMGFMQELKDKLEKLKEEKDQLEADIEQLQTELEASKAVPQVFNEMPEALAEYVNVEKSGDSKKIYAARRRLHQQLKGVIDQIVFKKPEVDGLHGTLLISFKGINEGYQRLIKVRKGLKDIRIFMDGLHVLFGLLINL